MGLVARSHGAQHLPDTVGLPDGLIDGEGHRPMQLGHLRREARDARGPLRGRRKVPIEVPEDELPVANSPWRSKVSVRIRCGRVSGANVGPG
jgi:hypothetical protein